MKTFFGLNKYYIINNKFYMFFSIEMDCNVNLIQSYTTKIDSESNLGQIVNRECFKDELSQQLFERRLSGRPELLTEQDCFTNQPLGKKHIDYNVQPRRFD